MEFTESQIVRILCEARLTPVNDVARKHNITEGTIHAWRGKFGELGAEDIKRLRHLKNSHAKRQRLVTKVGRVGLDGEDHQRSSEQGHGQK
jgi:putative transposase